MHIDTPKGPVHAVAHQMDATAARELALSQLDRARAAREAAELELAPGRAAPRDRAGRVPRPTPCSPSSAPAATGYLGEGGESQVFALDDAARAAALPRRHESAPSPVVDQLRAALRLLGADAPPAGFGCSSRSSSTPASRGGRSWTIDRRFAGGSLSTWLPTADAPARRAALTSLLDAAEAMSRLPMPVPGFARLVGDGRPADVRLAGRAGCRRCSPARPHAAATTWPATCPDVARAWDRLQRELAERVVTPALVHGDFCAPNAYVTVATPDGPAASTGVGDFSPHTLQADPLMDLTGAVTFLELEPYEAAVADSEWLLGLAVQRYGPEVAHWIGVYRRYFGFYFSDTAESDPRTYALVPASAGRGLTGAAVCCAAPGRRTLSREWLHGGERWSDDAV